MRAFLLTPQLRRKAVISLVLGLASLGCSRVSGQFDTRLAHQNNMRQIGGALLAYHKTYGRLPARAICDQDGKPLLSWRVELLPFLEQGELYKEFKLDETWDSRHNIQLLGRIPRAYHSPVFQEPRPNEKSRGPEWTPYAVPFGVGAAFEGHQALRIPADFPDGVANTILLVDTGEPVIWTKPDDFPCDGGDSLSKLGGVFPDTIHVVMVDGSLRSLAASKVKRPNLHAAFSRNGGETLPLK